MKRAFVVMLFCGCIANASVIAENKLGTAGTRTEFFGQSFTTPGGGPWDNITFNFYSDIPATTLSAAGTAFLLSTSYAGTPTALSSAAPGYIASSTGVSGGMYLFNPSLELNSNTTYWLYENASITVTGGDPQPVGLTAFAVSATGNFDAPVAQTANFAVNGTAVTASTVPEPASVGLALAGFLTVAFFGYRRRATRSA